MFWITYTQGLAVILAAALLTWLLSLLKNNVSIVDGLWSLLFLGAAVVYYQGATDTSERSLLVLVLVAIWAVRLSLYIIWRNWDESEDARYQAIRRNNEPHFRFKSLYIVFGLQGVLAWIISAPLLLAIHSNTPLNGLDYAALALWCLGFVFEAGGDFQLTRFKANPSNQGRVMDQGLWRYTRHPNYFGDFCIWWSFYLFAAAAGGWWTIFAPVLMAVLLLRVSGVALLERDISERRPSYREYIARTNAFFPGPQRTHTNTSTQENRS